MNTERHSSLPHEGVRETRSRRRLPGVALAAWVVVWLTITHVPAPPPGALPDWLGDKAIHFAGYAIMGALTIWYVSVRRRVAVGACVLGPWAAMTVLAAIDEATQKLVGRDCEWSDGVADVLGAGVGLTVSSLIWEMWNRNVRTAN